MEYDGIERRSSPDTIMLLREIQKVAVAAAQTSTDVALLRADFAEVKRLSCTDSDVDKKINDKLTDNRRWNIGAVIASIAAAAGIGAFIKGG